MRFRLLSVACLATALAVPAAVAAAAPSDTYESDVITSTNQERGKSRPKLAAQACLDRYAEAQAAASVKRQALKHSDLNVILDRCDLSTVGENVAAGFTSGKAVVAGWMDSSGHRANILNGSFTHIGVGAAQDSEGTWWVAQVFGTPA